MRTEPGEGLIDPGVAFVGKLLSIAGQASQLTGGLRRDVSFCFETDGGLSTPRMSAQGRFEPVARSASGR